MANWRKTKTPGVYVAHTKRCPTSEGEESRCRCEPSWRGRRWNPVDGRMEWQKPVTKDRGEVLSWLAAAKNGAEHLATQAAAGRTFESIGDEWLAGIQAGTIGRRRGRGKAYSATTIADYRSSYKNFLRDEFGPMPADDIGEVEWQMWADRLSREGLSRSRISSHVAVASAIYAWAITPSRRYAMRNPLRGFPPVDRRTSRTCSASDLASTLIRSCPPSICGP